MKGKKHNLIGKQFGRLTVLNESPKRRYGNVVWICQCICGNIIEITSECLTRGDTKSCGCLQKEKIAEVGYRNTKHGDGKWRKKRNRIYSIWLGMRARCLCLVSPNYKYYGGRGIKICPEWQNDYVIFKSWALKNGYAEGLTIDRIDNDGNYEPDNCQWITKTENTKKSNRKKLKYVKKQIRERFCDGS